jgi:glycosyltransferase involved in cell wall biosynthesis
MHELTSPHALPTATAAPPRLAIYCVAYKRYDKIPVLVHSLMCQSYRDFRLVVVHDGEDVQMRGILEGFKASYLDRFDFSFTESRRNDFGHSLRAMAIDQCDSEFILLTNDDNYYVPSFLERMFNKIGSEDLDLVLCDMVHSHERPGGRLQDNYTAFFTKPQKYDVDIGCFIVKSDLAKVVGFRDKTSAGDGTFVNDIMKNGGRTVKWGKVNKILFVHN